MGYLNRLRVKGIVMMGFSGWWGGSRRWSGYGGGGVVGETWKRETGVLFLNVL